MDVRLCVELIGRMTAYTIGLLDGYSTEQLRFISSGYICGACGEILIKRTWEFDCVMLDSEGVAIPILQARAKGKYCACLKCGHRWELRRKNQSQ